LLSTYKGEENGEKNFWYLKNVANNLGNGLSLFQMNWRVFTPCKNKDKIVLSHFFGQFCTYFYEDRIYSISFEFGKDSNTHVETKKSL